MNRIIFVNRSYWPEETATAQLLGDLAEGLAATGGNVSVLTRSALDRPPSATRNGVTILRLGSPRAPNPESVITRFVSSARFLTAGRRWLTHNVAAGDNIVAMTDPPLVGVAAARIGMKKNARIWHWVQDVYPEIAIELLGAQWLRWLVPMRDRAWQRAAGCVAVSNEMASLLQRHGVPPAFAHCIPNWAPRHVAPPPPERVRARREAWGLQGRFVVAYSGNLGRAHELTWLLDVAQRMRTDPRVAFALIGEGTQRTRLQTEAARRGLGQVHFLPSQPRALLAETLAVGNIHLVTMKASAAGLMFPSKLQGVAAVGRPVISVGPRDGELARIVENFHFGRAFTPADTEAVASTLRAWAGDDRLCAQMGASALEYHRTNGGFDRALAAWSGLLGNG